MALTIAAALASTASADVVTERFRDAYIVGGAAPAEQLDAWARQQRPDGSWPDVDYDTVDRVNLVAEPHLHRLGLLAREPRHADTVARGLRFWLDRRPTSANWWHRVIGAPRHLVRILTIAGDALPADLRDATLRLLLDGPDEGGSGFHPRADGDGEYRVSKKPATGANLIWLARVRLEAACLRGDMPAAAAASRRLAQEVRDDADEGIRPDLSLHQHGPLFYSGGYGGAFASDCATIADALRDTPLAFPPERAELLARYILDGQQPLIRGRTWDYGVVGRNICRRAGLEAGLAGAAEVAGRLLPARAEEAAAFAARLRGEAPADAGVRAANRAFPYADHLAHVRPTFTFAVHMSSTRTSGTESGNRENLRGFYLGDGATSLMRTGDEYRGLFPLWDWRLVPGVTAEQSDAPPPVMNWGNGSRGGDAFVGVASDGRVGLAAMRLDRAGLRGRKAWLAFDDAIVCLGSGITATTATGPVRTAVEQCRATAPVVADDRDVATDAAAIVGAARRVTHGPVEYLFPAGGTVGVSRERRRESWRTINGNDTDDAPAAGEVFTLWLDHGERPTDASYAYVIRPDGGEAAPPEILANTPALQAARHGDVAMAIFHAPGTLTIGDATLTVDQPCLAIVRGPDGATPTVTASNPLHAALRVHVTLTRGGQSTFDRTIDLPADGGSATAAK